ncbi:unnamed protein product [Thlaspi arvense]|uniref:Protein kinase domain-containing protein n=1 Tax=Thlaspi arvense TaxID=13288 RepID=A0AAU9SCZ0_THLAR|nr:unnamed protein product [Thlaspi arvense]
MESKVMKLKQNLRYGSSRKKKEEERCFLENGSKFLKELIADCNGKSIPIRSFSSSQILKATNNFDSSCFVTAEGDYKWYKVIIEDKSYMIKRFAEYRVIGRRDGEACNDIILSARMSNHNNFLKLFGCCLEFSFPVFVFEYAELGVLNWQGDTMVNGEDAVLPWSVRLKIAKEIANAVTYLHTAFPKIIIHRHIKVTNIFLDKNWTAKLSDFSLAITLPEGESRIEVDGVKGTLGYLDPLYNSTGFVSEYTDVYSFGICLLVFITGRSVVFPGSGGYPQGILSYVRGFYEKWKVDEVIDPMMANDITGAQRMQIQPSGLILYYCVLPVVLFTSCRFGRAYTVSFSSSQILKATNNFDSSCFVTQEGFYIWYKGVIEDRSYMIKRFSEYKVTDYREGEVYKDIVLSARMCNHNNFLKLLGCCLEFPFPVLVFEYAEHGVLNSRGGIMVNGEELLLPLSLRLKIAKEIANSLAYLHMAFPKIIIYRDVKPMHVFLDKNWTAKLSDMSYSISLDEGKTQVEAEEVLGTYGYLDPLYFTTGLVTEYTDVYSFGVFLMVLLTGRPVYFSESDGYLDGILGYVKGLHENGKLDQLIDLMMMKDISSGQRLQVEACVLLALRCCEERDEDRPEMIQVAKELKRVETSF